MHYNVNLGLLATDAITQLTKAERGDDDNLFRSFVQRSFEFCHSIRDSYDRLQIDPGVLPAPAGSFLSAVMKREQELHPQADQRVKAATELEPLLQAIIREDRRPTDAERLQIVTALYRASAADQR